MLTVLTLLVGASILIPAPVRATSADEIERQARNGLRQLYAQSPNTRSLANKAVAVLVFPNIIKGGFLFAGQYGEGALFMNNHVAGYYSTAAASYGLQAGIKQYGYAMFFMNESALRYLHKSDGWEIGAGPSVVIGNQSMGTSISSTKLSADVYTFFFNQEGIMGGLGLEGSKITRIHPRD